MTEKTNNILDIAQLIRDTEKRYLEDVKLGKFVKYNLYETTQEIQAYLNATHISGQFDTQGYEKPWDDVIVEAVNTRARATDLNVSNIRFIAPSLKYITANEIFKVAMMEWFQEVNFGLFLDKWGRELAEYNSIFVKCVKKGDKLHIDTVSWNNMIVDPINIKYAPVIEKMYLTEAELRERYTMEDGQIEGLITTRRKLLESGEIIMNSDGEYYEIYEAHAKEWDDELNKEINKMYVVSYLTTKSGNTEDFILYQGREEVSPYILTHLSPTKDRTMGRGVVEQLIPKQWLVNHYTYITKKTLDFSTKIGLQTSDKSFEGLNSLDDFETGDIMVTADNKQLSPINNQSHDISQTEAVRQEWKSSSRFLAGGSPAMSGEVKAGAAWRQTEALLQESHDLFNKMRGHEGLYLTDILSIYVVPFVLSRMNTKKEITAILDASSIEKIDRMYITSQAIKRANKKVAEKFLENANKSLDEMELAQNPDIAGEEQKIKESLAMQGNQRFFKPSEIGDENWGEYFKDFETKVIIDITGESVNTAENVTSLNTTMQTLLGAGLPLSHPTVKVLLGEIMRQTNGVSPLQLSDMEAEQNPQQINNPIAKT